MYIKLLLNLFLLLQMGVYCSIGFAENLISANETNKNEVVKQEEQSGSMFSEKIITYSYERNQCKVIWEVEILKNKNDLLLRTRDAIDTKCDIPFNKQLFLHRKVLNVIFDDWDKNYFSALITGPIGRLDPSRTWNIRIAMASADWPDWKDWRAKYPSHDSAKSINQIFVELVNSFNAYKELNVLFNEYGLSIKLESVEKVFGGKAKKLDFYEELKRLGLKSNPQVIYDAGMNCFKFTQNSGNIHDK